MPTLSRLRSWGMAAARAFVLALAAALLLATALPLLRGNAWWMRVFDFPRPQFAALLALALVAAAALFERRRRSVRALLAVLLLALGHQLWRIRPYTPLHAVQAGAAAECPAGDRLSVLVANLQVSNEGPERFLDLVARRAPDLVLALEIDAEWARALEPLHAQYPHRLVEPRPSPWGIALYSRLPLVEPRVGELVSDYVPSIRAGVRLPSGATVAFHGLHPKPPVIGKHGTAMRDAELLLAALAIRREGRPAVLAGDLNDVAWSRTTALMQRAGGLLDPRIGRGLYPTFPARLPPPLRWPIDHVFFTGEFRLLAMDHGPPVGADHLPFQVALCLAPEAAQPVPGPRPGDAERIEAAILAGHRAAAED